MNCKECNGVIVQVDGENVCKACGVVSGAIEEMPDPTRVGTSSKASSDFGLSTQISKISKDSSGKSFNPAQKELVESIRRWDKRTKNQESDEKNFVKAFNYLGLLKSKLKLNDAVIEKAAWIYRKGYKEGLIKSKEIAPIAASCVYLACKDSHFVRTLDDVAEATNVKKQKITKSNLLITIGLDLKFPVLSPQNCIGLIASKISRLGEKTRRIAYGKTRHEKFREFSNGKDPMSLAAGLIYAAAVETKCEIDYDVVAEAAGVSFITVRNQYRMYIEFFKPKG